jgi:hypothetical protein
MLIYSHFLKATLIPTLLPKEKGFNLPLFIGRINRSANSFVAQRQEKSKETT